MAVIRPYSPPVVTPQQPAQAPTQTRDAAEKRAAARAFFQQALGGSTPVRAAPAPAAAAPVRTEAALPSATAPVTASRGLIRPTPEEPPTRLMRPGSFIDIKV